MFWTLRLLGYLSLFCLVLFLEFCSVLSFGTCFFASSFWQPPCLFLCIRLSCYVSRLGKVALHSRCPVGSSGKGSLITQAGHPRFRLCPHMGCVHPSVEPWLMLAHHVRFTPKSISCKDWLQPPTNLNDQLCRGLSHRAGLTLGGALVLAESTPWVCHLWRWLVGASTWSEVVHEVHWLWGLMGDTGPGQLPSLRALPGATQHQLQSSLQMAATCARLGGAQERPYCKPRLAAASVRALAT